MEALLVLVAVVVVAVAVVVRWKPTRMSSLMICTFANITDMFA